MRIFVLKRLFEALIDLCGIMSDPAVLSVSNVLMPDGGHRQRPDIAELHPRTSCPSHGKRSTTGSSATPTSSRRSLQQTDQQFIRSACLDHLDIALGADPELLLPRVFVFVQLHRNDAVMKMMRPGGRGLALRTRPVVLGGLMSHSARLQATLCRFST